MLVAPYMWYIYLVFWTKITKIKTDMFSIVLLYIFLANFHLSGKKPVNVFFEGAVSLKTSTRS